MTTTINLQRPAVLVVTSALFGALAGGFALRGSAESRTLENIATLPVAISCGLDQRAVMNHSSGRVTSVECVDAARYSNVANADAAYLQAPASVVPASYVSAPVAVQPVVRAVAPGVRETVAPRARPQVKRGSTWQKRAMVIGGSAGAGAGVGALVGGKKGALIGAAIAGGGATIVDAVRNNNR